MSWEKYNKKKITRENRPLISFHKNQTVYFNRNFTKEYLKNVIEIDVYYDLDNHLIGFVPLKKKHGGFKLNIRNKAGTITVRGIFRKTGLTTEKTLVFSPRIDFGTKWAVINYTKPEEEDE